MRSKLSDQSMAMSPGQCWGSGSRPGSDVLNLYLIDKIDFFFNHHRERNVNFILNKNVKK
jgi:hypothetical protein